MDEMDYYYIDDDSLECDCLSWPYPEELYISSWDRQVASSDDWLDTWEYIKSIAEVKTNG